MERIFLNFLLFLFACLPAFLFHPFQRKRYSWCFILCSLLGAFLLYPLPRFALLLYALLLGICLFFVLYKPTGHSKLSSFFLCWNGSIAVLSTGHLLYTVSSLTPSAWFLLLFSFLVGLSFGLAIYWLSRWMTEDTVWLSEEHRISPLPLLITIFCLMLLLTFFGERFPIGCVFVAAVLQSLSLMVISLWNNMTLSVRHSQESSENSRQSIHLIDNASRDSEAALLRKLTESNNKLHQISLAYQNGDKETVSTLLNLSEEQGPSYCSHFLLDAILRSSAHEARNADLLPNFQLQLGKLQNFPLSDIGVLVDLMLILMIEHHPGKADTLRLRMQEWSDALIVVVGRRDPLRSVPESKMNTLLQLTKEYHGWLELTEKDRGICLSAVLFRPNAKE